MKILSGIIITLLFAFSLNAQTIKDEWVKVNNEGCETLDPYYSDGVTMKWTGKCVDGKANGYGKLTKYQKGDYESTYEGEIVKGIREGQGKFTHKDGSVKEGIFVNGQMTGKGTVQLENGLKYVGDFVNYKMHGQGTMHYLNGTTFTGFFNTDNPYTGKFNEIDGGVRIIQNGHPVKKINENTSKYNPKIGERVTEYFDENWKRCTHKNSAYYRFVTYESANKPDGNVKDYYMSGQLQCEFKAIYLDYDNEGKNFLEGEATWYDKNGNIEQKRYYINNIICGANTYYYDNGQIASESNYNYGTLHGDHRQWYKTGKLKIVAFYENGELLENKYIEYDENGLGAIIYKENFYENKSEWEGNSDDSESKITEDNQVEIVVTSDNIGAIRYSYIALEQKSDYSIESIVQKKKGENNSGYGLLFGFKDMQNYFQFLISGNGYFMISRAVEGINMDIAEWTASDYINEGNERNLLKVLKIDDTFMFSINGQVVKRIESSSLRGNNFGMYVNSKGDFVLENITIKEFVTNDELAKKTPNTKSPNSEEWKGNGTGFFIDKNGYIATNYHVVKDANDIEVVFIRNGLKKEYSAKVIQSDRQNDVSIIKINSSEFTPFSKLPYNFKTNISDVGSNIFALGYPMALSLMGTEIKFTDGKISSKTGLQGDIKAYQISVPIQPGNSGGPLFDYDGNIIGITTSSINREVAITDNVYYAVKSSYLKNLVDVMDYKLSLPNDKLIANIALTDKVKLLSDYVVLIKIR